MPAALVVDEPPTQDETKLTAEFIEFLKRTSASRPPGKNGEVLRFNQGRATGCVEAEVTVPADLPERLRVGFFAVPRTYKAIVRFANATSTTDRDRDSRGMTIGVLDVPGTNLTSGQTRQDFVLNSHPVMPAPDAREFMALLKANESGLRRACVLRHPLQCRAGRAGVTPESQLPPRHSVLEHHAVCVRRRQGREVHDASDLDAGQHTARADGPTATCAMRCARTSPRRGVLRSDGPVLRGRGQDSDRERDGGVDEGGLALADGGADQDSAAVDRRSGPHQPVRADGVQPLACPRRASSARRHEPGAAGNLPGA